MLRQTVRFSGLSFMTVLQGYIKFRWILTFQLLQSRKTIQLTRGANCFLLTDVQHLTSQKAGLKTGFLRDTSLGLVKARGANSPGLLNVPMWQI